MTRVSFKLLAIALVTAAIASSAFGQTSKGFFVGNITDQNGAVVAGAAVKITNAATGVTRVTTSTTEGSFRLDAVDPGTYRIEISQPGFKTITRDGLIISAAQTTSANFLLEVGTQTEMVVVTSGSEVTLQSQDGARVNTLSRREITDLPTPALNPANIVFTLPGVVDPGPLAGGFVQGNEFSVKTDCARVRTTS